MFKLITKRHWFLCALITTFMSHGMEQHAPANAEPIADQCAICLQIMVAGSTRQLICGHNFHQACINHWFTEPHNTCPYCQEIVVDAQGHDLQPVPAYQAPVPHAPGLGNYLRRGIAWTEHLWQRLIPQPARDVMGITLDFGAITAIGRSPEIIAHTVSHLNKTTRSETIAAEVTTGYQQTHSIRTLLSLCAPALEVHLAIPRNRTRAAALLYLNARNAQTASTARLAALNASMLVHFVAIEPITFDINERTARLMAPLFPQGSLGHRAATLVTVIIAETLANRLSNHLVPTTHIHPITAEQTNQASEPTNVSQTGTLIERRPNNA